ncbi:MAG: N-6 DNA methylase [Planctomycetia bacterium]|nr:N-6 DNA methylase [Planctomycetia bacterium]
MITRDNFPKLLEILGGFTLSGKVYTKTFDAGRCQLSVDFENEKLLYPIGIKIHVTTTCNFSQPENFVIFECIHRLLEKGYRPEHIELEKPWHLGHDSKSGRADICVYNQDQKTMLMIIECKTADEYTRAKRQLTLDGGQLFSYWQQERSTKWLSLYTCDLVNGDLHYENDIINCSDDENIKLVAKKDKSVLLYQNAQSVPDLFRVWAETYSKQIHTQLIFGEDTTAYSIGIKPLRKKDLREFSANDKIVNQFEEILRHNNVSDKENAFNRLIALFICKLVDEIGKKDNDPTEFQYKSGTDTYETLQDRLQRLHRDGMERFMKEKIEYVSDNYPEELFERLNTQKRKAVIEDLRRTIRTLKFFTNNDFSFKNVHNEELFYQNGKILVEMVQLFEKYRIVYSSKDQFLGDLFEKLLNKGFKQNEGQFFTPMPITRFIWDCLPLDKVLKKNDTALLPKIIDYACGAGHFLVEAIEAINDWYKRQDSDLTDSQNAVNFLFDEKNSWVEKCIFGIEKDYRLARVAKVSLFMNGAGEGKIVFGDGLDQYPDKGIENGTFDILVANPPYAVKGFKSHLNLKNNSFDLLEKISNDGSEIEVLFVERIAQLLKPQGIAAVILPSSILSNDSGSYIAVRKNILQNFYIRSIVQFGNKTFSETGTNTVVLFLEKYNEPPQRKNLVLDNVDMILNGTPSVDWGDYDILEAYCQKIGVSREDYHQFTIESRKVDEWNDIDYFAQYVREFRTKKTINGKLSEKKNFYNFVKEIERKKVYCFALAYQQNTLIITAPSDNAQQKLFLGYDWSKRKGAEGIIINTPGGKLYNDSDRTDSETLAAIVRSSFNNKRHEVPQLAQYYNFVPLIDLLDFSRTVFNTAIRLAPEKTVEKIQTKWQLCAIKEIVCLIETGSRPSGGVGMLTEGIYSLGGEHIDNVNGRINLKKPKFVPTEFYKNSTKGKLCKNDVLICKDGALTGKVAIVRNELENVDAMINEHIFILRCENLDTQKYLFAFLFSDWGQTQLKANITGSAQGGLNKTNLENIKIPHPPLDIQRQIVLECEKIDEEYNTSRMAIEEYRKKIEDIFVKLDILVKSGGGSKLEDLCIAINPSKSEIASLADDMLISFVDMSSVSNDGYIERKVERLLGEVRKGSYTYFRENDIIIAKITPLYGKWKMCDSSGIDQWYWYGKF